MSEINYKDADNVLFNENCKKYKYYPLIIPKQKVVIAIGDLHGDYDLTIRVLKLANLIEINGNDIKWIGKDTYVVQVGDQVDNCRPNDKKCNEPSDNNLSSYSGEFAEDIRILELFTDLNTQAEKENGAVISLYGNHELMNVTGNMNYVSYKDVMKFKPDGTYEEAKKIRQESFAPGNKYAEFLACTRMPAVIIGSFIFVHAGFITTFLEEYKITSGDDLYKISYSLRKWLLKSIDKHNVRNIINGRGHSLFWDRILGNIPPNMNNNDPQCIKYLKNALEIFKVDKMIIGHTPQFHQHNMGINKTCGDALWRIDFGGSYCFHQFDDSFKKSGKTVELRNVQVLKIIDDKEIIILSEKN